MRWPASWGAASTLTSTWSAERSPATSGSSRICGPAPVTRVRLAASQLHGFDPVVWPHLQRADVLIVPSRLDEPFGNTAVEGALAARPIVVSQTSGLVEASEGLEAAVGIPPGDVEAIADAVTQIIEGWAMLRLAAVADAERAAVRFSPATYRAAMADLVADLLP